MNVGLLALSGVVVRTKELAELGVSLPGFVERGKVIATLPSLGLLTVGALTPEGVDLEYVEVPDADSHVFRDDLDLVAISTYTAQVYDAYQVADQYRKMGIPVVIGGLHATALPLECKQHADAVVLGEAEESWPQLLRDFQAGALRPFYRSQEPGSFDLSTSPVPRYDLLPDMGSYNRVTIQTSRGCPHRCEFCGNTVLFGPGFRQKPVPQVIAELEAVLARWDRPFIEFADDNSFVDKAWSKELCRALIPYGIRYFTESDIAVAEDDELLELMHRSGCFQLLIGLESVSHGSLAGLERHDWKLRKRDGYLAAIEKIQSHGISVNGCFVLGLDDDDPGIFRETLDFIENSGLIEAQLTVATPLPGTPFLGRLQREGRLLQEHFWDRCTLFDVNFRPMRMSPLELEEGLRSLMRSVYSQSAVQRRKRHYIEMVKSL